ncbi:hypothetical protein NP493_1212g00015 [Ridgeia piscesae]|uniref:G-protein coupled receptors family 1 profile domain-containing protein n=1 Tax=Ridgeia piscesae TaxID=27915 RepID=A0AAD9NHU9_RIDPI|nr:hypothetical protein NP493_1212g00015 [Ridgeia piscesae]
MTLSINQPVPHHPILSVIGGTSSYATGITLEKASIWFIVAFIVELCVIVRFQVFKLRLCTPRNAVLFYGSLLVLTFVKNIDLVFMDAIVVSIMTKASTWFIVAFTVERCVVVRAPLRRLSTPSNAGLCCGSLLVLAFVKNIDLFFIHDLVVGTDSGDAICTVPLRYRHYLYSYRPMITFVTSCVIPTGVVLVCNWTIIRTLRRDLVQTTARDSIVRHTTIMCLAVSFVFIVCVAPAHVFYVNFPNWPMSLQDQYDVLVFLLLLRYANHAVNFFLYSLTGAHFRCELVALFHRCIQRGLVTAGCLSRLLDQRRPPTCHVFVGVNRRSIAAFTQAASRTDDHVAHVSLGKFNNHWPWSCLRVCTWHAPSEPMTCHYVGAHNGRRRCDSRCLVHKVQQLAGGVFPLL